METLCLSPSLSAESYYSIHAALTLKFKLFSSLKNECFILLAKFSTSRGIL